MTVAGSSAIAVPVRPGEHACCSFPRAEDRERLAVAFIRDRVRRGDKVVYFFDGDDATALVSRFGQLDTCMPPAVANGQLELRRARDAYLPDDHFEGGRMVALLHREHDRARAEGYDSMSVVGEVPACELHDYEQLRAYEAQLDDELASCSLLCQYDHRRFDAGRLSHAIGSHKVQASPDLAAIGRDGEHAASTAARRLVALLGWDTDPIVHVAV